MNEQQVARIASSTASSVDDALTSVGLDHASEDQDLVSRCQLMGLMMVLATRLTRMGVTEEDAVRGLVDTMHAVSVAK